MIASTSTPSSPSIRDEFAGVKWTGNVTPVDQRTQRLVLEQFHQEQQLRPARLKPTRHDVDQLTETALYVLQLFAEGLCTGAVAETCGVHRVQIVRFRNWMAERHGFDIKTLRLATDRTLDGLRGSIISGVFRTCSTPPKKPAAIAAEPKLPRIDKAEILSLSDRVVRILQRVSMRMSDEENAAHEGVRMEAVGHVLRVLQIRKTDLEVIRDKSLENVRRLTQILVPTGGATC
jgi:hypothetical protein